jgi:hypothetical protein
MKVLGHLEHTALLHDEVLASRKTEFDRVKKHFGHRDASNDENTVLFNAFQEMLSLRPIITEVLYEGRWDGGHRDIVGSVRRLRDKVAWELIRNKSDGSSRVSISACMDRFLTQAEAREYNPQSWEGWQRDLTVNLADIRHIQYLHRARAPDTRNPSVSRLFSNPRCGHSMRRGILSRWAGLLCDMPSCPGPETSTG